MVFEKHHLISHLSEQLLNVFVTIEMTGQSVQFEQKFNYRRPMYQVLHYIWEKDLHKAAIEVKDFQPFPKQALVFMCLQNKSVENTVGKAEIALNKQFLHFPQCFLCIELSAIFIKFEIVACKLF